MICKLCKALYSLKQLPCLWYKCLSTEIVQKLGFKRLQTDHGVFTIDESIADPIISIHVNDINLFTPIRFSLMQKMKAKLSFAFKIIDIGFIQFYLNQIIERDRENRFIKFSQLACIKRILAKFHLHQAHLIKIPMKNIDMFLNKRQANRHNTKRYQEITGLVIFSMIETQPNIAISTSLVS